MIEELDGHYKKLKLQVTKKRVFTLVVKNTDEINKSLHQARNVWVDILNS